MEKTVELVNRWADFATKHPGAELEDFCRYYLTSEREKSNTGTLLGGITPKSSKITLNKLIIFIARIHALYANMAMDGIPLKQFEEFHFLNSIHVLRTPKKTEVINYTMNELSTGLNILASLREQGYIAEEDDLHDKRSRRVTLTPEGVEVLMVCRKRFSTVSDFLFAEMDEEDSLLCIQLLKNVEIKYAKLWQQHKGQKFDDIYEEVMSSIGKK